MVGRLDSMITKDSRHMADRNPRASQPGLGRRAGPRRGRGRLRGLAAVGVAPVATATVSVPAAAAITVPAAARVTGPTAVPSTVTGPASVTVPATVTVGTRPVGAPWAVAGCASDPAPEHQQPARPYHPQEPGIRQARAAQEPDDEADGTDREPATPSCSPSRREPAVSGHQRARRAPPGKPRVPAWPTPQRGVRELIEVDGGQIRHQGVEFPHGLRGIDLVEALIELVQGEPARCV